MIDLLQTIRDFVLLFDELRIRYAIMGGWAVRAYGLPRPTYDIDFTIACERDRLPELYKTATQRGFSVPEQYQKGWVDSVAEMPLIKFRLYLQERAIDIDIFLAESEFQTEILARRQQSDLDGLTVWFVSPEDLILLKLIASRPEILATFTMYS